MDDGGQTYRAPALVIDACRAALSGGSTLAKGFAGEFAAHIVGGEPVDFSTVEKVFDAFSDGEPGLDPVEASLLGGSHGRAWVEGLIGKRASAPGVEFSARCDVIKVDDELGLVFGWAIICTENGKPYFDTQGDNIPDASMLKASADFMKKSRGLGDMHTKAEGGSVVFAWPMTKQVAKAFGYHTEKTGLMIAVAPDSEETLEKYRSGKYTGFSIGGRRGEDEEV